MKYLETKRKRKKVIRNFTAKLLNENGKNNRLGNKPIYILSNEHSENSFFGNEAKIKEKDVLISKQHERLEYYARQIRHLRRANQDLSVSIETSKSEIEHLKGQSERLAWQVTALKNSYSFRLGNFFFDPAAKLLAYFNIAGFKKRVRQPSLSTSDIEFDALLASQISTGLEGNSKNWVATIGSRNSTLFSKKNIELHPNTWFLHKTYPKRLVVNANYVFESPWRNSIDGVSNSYCKNFHNLLETYSSSRISCELVLYENDIARNKLLLGFAKFFSKITCYSLDEKRYIQQTLNYNGLVVKR